MQNKHLEFKNGQRCIVNGATGEESGMKDESEPVRSKPVKEDVEEHFGPRTYLENFTLNTDVREVYPYKVIHTMGLRQITFAPVTIIYGNNASGKSTLLNVIAKRIGMTNKTEGNTNAYFADYVESCNYQTMGMFSIPEGNAFLRSEDIMDGIVKNRRKYASMKKAGLKASKQMPAGEGDAKKLDNLMNHPDALSSEDRFYISRCKGADAAYEADSIADLFESNGEVALKRIEEIIMPDGLYFLDEPEISLSPVYQKRLADIITLFAGSLRTQFVIATHSPFFLSLKDALIYDLDSHPVTAKKWFQLPNMLAYFNLFEENRDQFIKH
jgi:predicted ATPase